MIQLYTGEGKGKTTAAVGQAVRAAGCGLSVLFVQFMKGSDTGELHGLSQIEGIEILRSHREFGFFKNMTQAQKRELTQIHNQIAEELIRRAAEGQVRLMVLDEVSHALNLGLVEENKIRKLLDYAGELELVLTGRDMPAFLREEADYITEMACIRHPYERGIGARRGIEY